MPTKGERGTKATDFSIAAIMAPRGPSFGHYHLHGLSAAAAGNAAQAANTALECAGGNKAHSYVTATSPTLDHRESWSRFLECYIVVCVRFVRESWRLDDKGWMGQWLGYKSG